MEHSLKRVNKFNKVFLNICKEIASLSRCNRAKVGAVIVKDKKIISFGYNGTPDGYCNECEDENNITKKEVLHAESNAILKAKTNLKDSVLYLTLSPCVECCKLIKQAGIKKVFFIEAYRDMSGLHLFKIDFEQITLDYE
jgi:dCMP deaminase